MLGVSRLLALLEAAQLKSALLCAVHSELKLAIGLRARAKSSLDPEFEAK